MDASQLAPPFALDQISLLLHRRPPSLMYHVPALQELDILGSDLGPWILGRMKCGGFLLIFWFSLFSAITPTPSKPLIAHSPHFIPSSYHPTRDLIVITASLTPRLSSVPPCKQGQHVSNLGRRRAIAFRWRLVPSELDLSSRQGRARGARVRRHYFIGKKGEEETDLSCVEKSSVVSSSSHDSSQRCCVVLFPAASVSPSSQSVLFVKTGSQPRYSCLSCL